MSARGKREDARRAVRQPGVTGSWRLPQEADGPPQFAPAFPEIRRRHDGARSRSSCSTTVIPSSSCGFDYFSGFA